MNVLNRRTNETTAEALRPIATAAILLAFLAGCSTETKQLVETPAVSPTTRTTEATTDPEETPEPQAITTDPEPPAIPEPPILPDAAKENTEEGALAFAEYWRELINYTFVSNDTSPLFDIALHQCTFCKLTIRDSIERSSQAKIVKSYNLEYFEPPILLESRETAKVLQIRAVQSSYTVVGDGTSVGKFPETRVPEEEHYGVLAIHWGEQRWHVFGYGPIK